MHALLLTVVMLTGAEPNEVALAGYHAGPAMGGDMVGGECLDGACGGQGQGHGLFGRHGHRGGGGAGTGGRGFAGYGPQRVGICTNMPQSCYDPKYGCYGNNDRHFQRYPAFHGTYYRRPYNYRNLFDYPWHAELHEPTSLFSYNVPNDPTGGLYGPGGQGYGPGGYGPGYDGQGKPQPPSPPALDGAQRAPTAAPHAARSTLQR